MCLDPATWVAIGGIVLGAVTADSQADAQGDALTKAGNLAVADAERMANEAASISADQQNEQARQAARDFALFDVVSGEYGGGASVGRQASIGRLQSSENLATIQRNSERQQGQIGFDAQAASFRNNQQLAAIDRPSWLGTSLRLGSAVLGDSRFTKKS